MTTYLLDTNACIVLINGTQAHVRRRFQRAVDRDRVVLLSSVALRGLNRTEIAAKLRVTHQSASKRLIAAEWDTFVVGCKLIGDLIASAQTANPR